MNVHGELKRAQIEHLSSDPTGILGRFYYNTVKNVVRYYNGSVWRNTSRSVINTITADPNSGDAAAGGTDQTKDDIVLCNATGRAFSVHLPTAGNTGVG